MRFRVAQASQYDYSRFARGGDQVSDQGHPAVAAKIKVEQNDVGVFRIGERQGVIAVAGFPYNRHACAALNDQAQAGTDDGVIVDQQYSNGLCCWSHHVTLPARTGCEDVLTTA
jgi:hypothetical protein